MPDAIVLNGLEKRYGETTALDGLDLVVPEATVMGLLGPNGAGKTTSVRILSTLLRPDGGSAQVFGADVVRDARRVRATIGLTGQFSAVDDILTGAENLRMIGRLFRLGAAEARSRADDLLAAFDLTDAANRQVKTYSGGMRRRLDLAGSLMARPRLLILDEPTSGLDPRSRLAMWDVIAELRRAGTTVLLTTQYLEEADRLADAISVIDHGKLVASGTADELKSQVGGDYLEIKVAEGDAAGAAEALARASTGRPVVDKDKVIAAVGSLDDLPEMLLELRRRKIHVADVAVRRPTLDDVFLRLTGQPATAPEDDTGRSDPPLNGKAREDDAKVVARAGKEG
ncbi:MAG TPA: ATP-binding cassette domain-containing protein [Micromonosporaceae bacterium]|nr:ATP-binding cassette domain-containing protein [Micromonosporaceae bacterium]